MDSALGVGPFVDPSLGSRGGQGQEAGQGWDGNDHAYFHDDAPFQVFAHMVT
jgi:hypothetical protein